MDLFFDKMCRVCLNDKGQYNIYVTTCKYNCLLFSEMFHKSSPIKPLEDDGLPVLICKPCSRQLKRSYEFNVLCLNNDIKLKEMLIGTKLELKEKLIKNEDFLLQNDVIVKSERLEDSWDAEDDNITLCSIKTKVECAAIDDVNQLKQELDITEYKNTSGNNKFDKCIKTIESHVKDIKNNRNPRGSKNGVPLSKKPHPCDICGKVLSTRSNLKEHKLCHTSLRPYKCLYCDATFRGYSALFQHRKIHTKEKPYKCDYCGKEFARRTAIINHIKMHTGHKCYECKVCNKRFVQASQLYTHNKRHIGEKSYLCTTCGKGFPVKSDLRIHERVHTGEKPFSCLICSKTFATAGNLSVHVRIHSSFARYKCPHCEKAFKSCSSYNVHIKRHKGQRDYKCECGKQFYTSTSLKQHMVVHTGEKKYQCLYCERKFTQSGHCTRHIKKDHKVAYVMNRSNVSRDIVKRIDVL